MVQVQAWTMIPFAVMLLLIATVPLFAGKFWESNRNKLICTLALAVPTAIYLICAGMGHNLLEQICGDYIPFIILLLALYTVTGGIMIKGDMLATPTVNAAILFIGFVLASFMGTTGAAMLLIRPLIDINKERKNVKHTILFFTAMVANCGGILTPLGDPPLFLLYLRGAPFGWFSTLIGPWAVTGALLLITYICFDRHYYKNEPLEVRRKGLSHLSPIRVKGRINFLWLAAIMLSVIFINRQFIPAMGEEGCFVGLKYLREIVLVLIIIGSWLTTSQSLRKANHFNWSPIVEVAILFVGIFTTMTPALMYLSQNAASLGLSHPWQFFYSTGLLSSFLDNSPTAVAFYSVASGLDFSGCTEAMVAGIPETFLRAIALGAVFFGSMTYIGNGPNFMVKAIAESRGITMPSFLHYIIKFSLLTLMPIYIVVQLLFL